MCFSVFVFVVFLKVCSLHFGPEKWTKKRARYVFLGLIKIKSSSFPPKRADMWSKGMKKDICIYIFKKYLCIHIHIFLEAWNPLSSRQAGLQFRKCIWPLLLPPPPPVWFFLASACSRASTRWPLQIHSVALVDWNLHPCPIFQLWPSSLPKKNSRK